MRNYGDFCGFSFNGVHSTALEIVRVSGGSRYTENTIPNFQDKTTVVPGANEAFYFGTQYQQKSIPVSIAFDNMDELKYRYFRQVFDGKNKGDLIFDELPYKAYQAKVQSPPQLKTICFNDENNNRVYKGEGTINFVCYYPFAICKHKSLSDTYYDNYSNISEWNASSRLISNPPIDHGSSIDLYNPGDLPTDWIVYFNTSNLPTKMSIGYYYNANTAQPVNLTTDLVFTCASIKFNFSGATISSSSTYIGLNSRTRLLEGYTSTLIKDNSIYNQYITEAFFGKIPTMLIPPQINNKFILTHDSTADATIQYDYLYY